MKTCLTNAFLGYVLEVSPSTISRTFLDVLHVMHVRLVPACVIWPGREELRLSLPISFRKSFKNCAVIIDCFEIILERASSLKARAQTFSSYKARNTTKYLIGITPQGSISFISKGFGGRTTDTFIVNNCSLLDNLLPGDLVLADRGFDISESVGLCASQVKIPAFTRGVKQLNPLDIESTRLLASQRIHVERVIGLARRKYGMLRSFVRIDSMKADIDGFSTLDKVVRVACALTNLSESIVAFD